MTTAEILPNLDAFRREIASCPNAIEAIRGDFSALCRHVGLNDEQGSHSLYAVTERLLQSIASSFSSGHREVLAHFRNLRKEMIYSSVLDSAPVGTDLLILEIIIDAIRPPQGFINSPPIGDWKLAVRNAIEHQLLSPSYYRTEPEYIERFHRRDLEVARAALRLSNRGYSIQRETGKLFLEQPEEDKLVKHLQRLVTSFPGIKISKILFSFLSSAFDPLQERYHYVRRTSSSGIGSPQIPINYLLQICAKHPFGVKPYRGSKKAWEELISLSVDYAAIFDVQHYSSTELLFKNTLSLLPFLQELALYDSIFPVPQMRSSDVIKVCRGILGFLDHDEMRGSGWMLNELFAVGESILSFGKVARGSSAISLSDVIRECPRVKPEIVRFALNEVFCHPPSGANQRFNKPTDAPEDYLPRESRSGHDFFERPLLKTGKDSFFLLEKPFCSAAVIESVLTALRSTNIKSFESHVGEEMERFLLKELELHGIPTIQGDYDDAIGMHGECDVVIECSDTIIFVEIKKQTLTRKARAGSDVALIVDMAASLLCAQLQAGWHEVRIRRDGFLLLKKDGGTRRVDLAGRSIERIAVTLLDYGSFQDRTLLQQFLKAQLGADYSVTDQGLKSKFVKINEQLDKLRIQVAELQRYVGGEAERFFNCWFLSIPQFLVLLDGVSSPEDLKTALWNTRHSSMGTMDFYFEHSEMKRIRAENS